MTQIEAATEIKIWHDLSSRLKAPFPENDIEWRISQSGFTREGKPWGKCLAYIDNRAIMDRLDEVVGPGNWQNSFQEINGGFMCGIGIRLSADHDWVWKYDGAQTSNFEALKGGISGSQKRAAVEWGIGRYLYNLSEGWCEIVEDRAKAKYVGTKIEVKGANPKTMFVNWNPPLLPTWALPSKK